jgi:hypothetical protein
VLVRVNNEINELWSRSAHFRRHDAVGMDNEFANVISEKGNVEHVAIQSQAFNEFECKVLAVLHHDVIEVCLVVMVDEIAELY